MKISLYPRYFIRSLFVHNKKHGFFREGYKLLHPEFSSRGMTPWQHYVIEGRRKGYGDGNDPAESVFFREGYEAEYPDVKESHEDAWHHYASKGRFEGRDNGLHPSAEQFFAEGYLELYPDIAQTGADPWRHYVLRGKKEGRDSGLHPSGEQFYSDGYLRMYPDIAEANLDPWRHYVLNGKKEGRDNGLHPGAEQFFPAGYLLMYPDAADCGHDPWHHCASYGRKHGYDNGLHPDECLFFAEGYLAMYPDIAEHGIDPWRHYVMNGKAEGRDNGNHPKADMFFPEGYLLMYPDVAETGMDPWKHYVRYGRKEGRDCGLHPGLNLFFAEGYLEMYPYLAMLKVDPWRHYVLHGRKDGLDSGLHPKEGQFFAKGYLEANLDVAKAGVDPWWHYVMCGKKEGRDNAVISELDFLTSHFSERKNRFLLISPFGTGDGVSIWRIQFLKEFLEKHLAVHADIEYRRALSPMFIKRIQECRCVIFSRPENDLYFEAVYRYCHRNHIKFVVDVDDLLLPGYGAFELGAMKSKLLTMSAKDIDARYTMSKVNQCLPFAAVDGLICSTRKLAVLYGEHLKSAAHIHPNLVSRSIFDEIPGKISSLAESGEPKFKRSNDFRLSLLIADGSKTHLYDLSTVILELLSFLKSHQDVQLTLLGLNLDNSRFLKKALGRQLRVIPRVSYDEMLYIYSINDLLIVPLDLNIFNECKSNIKFIEAATVRKPCLVRDIYEFSKDITDGKNGLLYSDSPGFIQKLEWAYENAGLLQDLGNAANRYVSRNLTTDCLDQTDTDFFASLLKE